MEIKKEVLDVRNTVCPYPAFLTTKKLKEISPGSILEVICDKDETVKTSLTTTLNRLGYKYEIKEESNNLIITVYKS
jgi:TusA-related sulfurtransferase